jgi:hypothetical protein
MIERVPCAECGALILPSTAEETGGLCMPCKGGYRKDIEEGRRRIEEEKKRRDSPGDRFWRSLVDRVHRTPEGYGGLTEAEQVDFAVCVLEGEVYNGGFEQYFFNSRPSRFCSAQRQCRQRSRTDLQCFWASLTTQPRPRSGHNGLTPSTVASARTQTN